MKLCSITLLSLSLIAFAQDAALSPLDTKDVEVAKAIPISDNIPKPVEPEADDDSPVPLPVLNHFAKLWNDSLFTTKALPAPDVPAGPKFTDNLTLSGTFEDNGKMTAVLIDRTTSGIVQAYIGEDNEDGFRIVKIETGESPDKMRIQLQKGNQTGWVSFADASSGDGGASPQGTPQQQPGVPNQGPLATRPQRNVRIPPAAPQPAMPVMPNAPPGLQNVPVALPATSAIPEPPSNLTGGAPQVPAALPGDPPLPPP